MRENECLPTCFADQLTNQEDWVEAWRDPGRITQWIAHSHNVPWFLHKHDTIVWLQLRYNEIKKSIPHTSVMIELKFHPSSFRKHPTSVPDSWIPDLPSPFNPSFSHSQCITYVHMISTGCVSLFKISSRPSLINSSDTGRHVDGCVGFHVAIPRWTCHIYHS